MPALIGRLVTTAADVARLAVPAPGDGRTRVHLDAAALLVAASPQTPVLGGLIGPFSLAARLFGVAETLEATLSEPAVILSLLERVTPFLIGYALELRRLGAAGVVMAEPVAGLLSPRGLARFSTPFVKRVVDAAQDPTFAIVLHNCGAKIVHLDRILESGAEFYHFGAPMDLPAALARVDGRVVICGNLDPTFIHAGPPSAVRAGAKRLLAAAAGNRAWHPGTHDETLLGLHLRLGRRLGRIGRGRLLNEGRQISVQLFHPRRGRLLNKGRQISVLPLKRGRCQNTRHRAVLRISDEKSGHNTDPQIAFALDSTDFSIGTTT